MGYQSDYKETNENLRETRTPKKNQNRQDNDTPKKLWKKIADILTVI